MATELAKAYVQIIPSAKGIKGAIESELGDVAKTGNTAGNNLGSSMSGAFGTAIKGLGVALAGAAAGVGVLAKSALDAYANTQQLVGGVETLFGTGGKSLEEYADSIGKTTEEATADYNAMLEAQETVLSHAKEAYKTAGLSANDYMETVTSFSAALIASLDGQTDIAATVANQAIVDMSDNANKMGSSMESIQNAYQGFAKQNYTMLDNLKLGYGGTKSEMERLLEDASKISGIEYNIDSYANIIDAIHVIQTEMGITGTTAKEATETISGAFGMLQGSWTNLVAGLADPDADLSELVGNLVESVQVVIANVAPVIMDTLPAISDALAQLINEIAPLLAPMLKELLPSLLESAVELINGLVDALPDILSVLSELIPLIVEAITSNLEPLLQAGIEIILQLSSAIAEALPELIPQIVDIILSIVDTLINNIDLLVDGAIALVVGLTEGIINALPQLIERVPEIILKLADAIVRNAPQLVSSAWEIIKTLGEALITYTPQLLAKVPEMVNQLVEKYKELVSKYKEIGTNIIDGIKEGLANSWHKIMDWLKGKCGEMIDTVKSYFGIHSPSTVFRDQIGVNLAAGIGVGFMEEMENVNKMIDDSLEDEFDLSTNVNLASTLSSAQPTTSKVNESNPLSDILNKLNEKLDDLGNQQIVLDSGVLVGATAPIMNDALGNMARREAYA